MMYIFIIQIVTFGRASDVLSSTIFTTLSLALLSVSCISFNLIIIVTDKSGYKYNYLK